MRFCSIALFLFHFLLSLPAFADPTNRPEDVQKLLDEVGRAYAQIQSLKLSGTISRDFDVNGEVTHEEAPFEAAFQSPDRFRHSAQGDAIVGADGKQTYFYFESYNRYTQTPVGEKKLAEAMSDDVKSVLLGQNPSLLAAVTRNADQMLFNDAKDLKLNGKAKIDGVDCDVLKFTANKMAGTLYFDSATHLLRKREMDALGILQSSAPDAKKAIITIHYRTIDSGPTFAQDAFAWTPPAGAREATDHESLAGGEPSELEGQPAPAFKLKSLAGEEVSLDGLKGSVVVIDFWATWCGPCRASLPELDKLNEETAPKGAKIFAINLEEETKTIEQFVKDTGLKVAVLFDTDSKVAKSYNVTGIPQTVVIGRDGKIKKVIVGFGGDAAPLKDAVNAALAE